MTTSVTRWNQPARSRRLAAAGLALAILGACSGSSGVKAAKSTTASTAPYTTGAGSVSTTAGAAPRVDVNQLLAAYAGGYQFTTSLTIGGAVTAKFVGRRFGTSSVVLVTQGGLTIDEVITPAGAWVRQPGQEWTEQAALPNTDPLEPLRTPRAVTPQPDGSVNAIYPAEAFGLAKGDLPVVITSANGVLSKVRYDTTVGGKPATIETVFAPLTDTTPITAPA